MIACFGRQWVHNNGMNKQLTFPCHVIGLMSGTSVDGIDAAMLYTDGRDIVEAGVTQSLPYPDALRQDILGLMQGRGDVKATQLALTELHIKAVEMLQSRIAEPVKLIGFHGQTIKHSPELGTTRQIGDAALMVKRTGISVVNNFRSRDMREGGQGAPLVPLYHAALAHTLPKPLMVVNIGGVANITWLGDDGHADAGAESRGGVGEARSSRPLSENIFAFDCGPGNALMDDWFYDHTKQRYDEDGRVAARGKINEKAIQKFLRDPFFRQSAPKSLDRQHFSLDLVKDLSFEDGIATLTAMTARAIAQSLKIVAELPHTLLITGGGRHNLTLMKLIHSYVHMETGKTIPVTSVEEVGWEGDMLEAQAFAYLAARSVQGLALSLPTTTGVDRPVTGGVFYPA